MLTVKMIREKMQEIRAQQSGDAKDYDEIEVIEVPHQGPVRTYSCASFSAAASAGDYETWGFDRIESLDDVAEMYDGLEEAPEALKNAKFPVIATTWPGEDSYHDIIPAAEFDEEDEAWRYLGHDLHRLIAIRNDEEALDVMNHYTGHQDVAVHLAARKIYEKHNADKYVTRDREAGNVIDGFAFVEDARAAIKKYEEDDRLDGNYTPDFYDVAERDDDGDYVTVED